MSIATEIQRLQTAKSDLKTAIEAKGVTVPSSATIDTYDDYVSQISGGGGETYEDELKGLIDRSISAITIPSGVTSIGNYVFDSCSNLSSVTIPNSVTSIGNSAFYECYNLTSVTIPNSVISIYNFVFYGCRSLTSVIIPDSVTNIGIQAFYGCRSLTSITVNTITPPTLGSNAFVNTNDCPIYVPSESVETFKTASEWSTYASRIQAIPNS